MKADFTDISVVLDRSGSMQSVKDATIDALNKYVDSQKTGVGTANLTLVQFDDQYEVVYSSTPIASVPALNGETYVPRGYTALLDAIGKTIISTGARLSAIPEADRPGTVLFVIQTDGHENSSREFDKFRISSMIAEQRDKYGWQFVFLGANQDAIASAATIGINADQALGYHGTRKSTEAAFNALSQGTHQLRTARASGQAGASYQVSAKDRADAGQK